MHHPVEYGVGGGGVCLQTVVPVGDGDLRGYDCRLAAVAVLDDLHKVEYLLVVEFLDSEVIDYDQVI